MGDHLRAWKAQQEQTQQIATKEHLPEELIAVLKGLWERVMNQTEDKIQLIQQETQQELVTSKQTIQNLHQDNTYWRQQHQKTKQERDSYAHGDIVIVDLADENATNEALTRHFGGVL